MSIAERAKRLLVSLKSFLLAGAIVLIIIGGLWLYSGVWPPLVVVESASMQHSDARSFIGVIDTGDLVIMKKETSLDKVHTYLGSVSTGYSTYSELGDVVIYRPYGNDGVTPIIHRALCRVDYNETGGGFDVPELASVPYDIWDVSGGAKTRFNLQGTLILHDVGYNQIEVSISFATILSNFGSRAPHGGLITLGDNNHGNIDQNTLCLEPIKAEWLNGVARGELPWFGLIKLYVTGQASQVPVPKNSESNLLISLGLIIGVPIAIDVTNIVLESKGIDAGAWLRKKLHLPPKKVKQKAKSSEQEDQEKGEAAATKKEGAKKTPSSAKKDGSSGKIPSKKQGKR